MCMYGALAMALALALVLALAMKMYFCAGYSSFCLLKCSVIKICWGQLRSKVRNVELFKGQVCETVLYCIAKVALKLNSFSGFPAINCLIKIYYLKNTLFTQESLKPLADWLKNGA